MRTPPLVSVLREREGPSSRRGFVVAESESLIAVQSVSDRYDLDGYQVFRRADITIEAPEPKRADVVERALRLKGLAPTMLPWLDLTSYRTAIEGAQKHYAVVVIHRELVCPDECEVGTVRITSDATYVLRWLDPDAYWELDHRPFRYDDITLLTFGGEYETTLARVADDRDDA